MHFYYEIPSYGIPSKCKLSYVQFSIHGMYGWMLSGLMLETQPRAIPNMCVWNTVSTA